MPDLDNLQGFVVHSYRQSHFAVLLFKIVDAARARFFLRNWRDHVAHGGQDLAGLAGPLLNFGLSWAGLRLLIAGDPLLDAETGARQLDFGFVSQTPDHLAVKSQLGFLGGSDPAGWWNAAFPSSSIHLAVYGAFDDADQRSKTLAALRQSASDRGLAECEVAGFADRALSGYRPPGGILHFGYRDEITTPNIAWDDDVGGGKVNFREVLMGYPSDDYPVPPRPDGPWRDFVRDGSFACFAWIHQDVAAFNRFLDANASKAVGHAAPGRERHWIAAKLLGRWPDGSPLVRHPERPPDNPDLADDFGFDDDPDGLRCPLTAHIRVANLRDQALTFPNQSRFPGGPPRMVRRGFSYGPPLAGTVDDGVDRGVVGTFICARVNEQFYTVLRWIQKTDFAEGYFAAPHAGSMQDALFGARSKPGATTAMPIRVADGVLRADLVDFITYRGVAVFFLPSLRALDRLARA